jgi:hypothetical protein
MPVAYGYVRCSHDKQAESGLGEEGQRQEILRYYETNLKPKGAEWGKFFEDTSTPIGRAMRQMMAMVDELSSGMTSQRNEAAAAVLKSQGRQAGGPGKPYGYHKNPGGKMPPDVPERRLMEFMVKRHLIDRVYDRELIVVEIRACAAAGIKVSREWTAGKVKAAIAAFWRIVENEGVGWILDPQVKKFALNRKGGK